MVPLGHFYWYHQAMFAWIRRWRQSRMMKRTLPPEWTGWLEQYVPFYPEVIVYPNDYLHPDSDDVILGEAQQWGTVVLSWDAVLDGMANGRDGHDTALHEFAHVLDVADGAFDGTPELHRFGDYRTWARVMRKEFLKLRHDVPRRRTVLREYGATDEAEFFAVASETFFEKPQQLKEKAPELYEELSRFYRVEP
jgi:Mlc titration factor MtfA (ptsG expression regulator)